MKKLFCLIGALVAFILSTCVAGFADAATPIGVPEPGTLAVLAGLGVGALLAGKALKRK